MNDDDLRRRFLHLRETEAREIPGYTALRERSTRRRTGSTGPHPANPPRPRGAWLWLPAAGAAVAAALLMLRSGAPPEPSPDRLPNFEPGRWAMPTDVLLEIPGSRLLRELPRFELPTEPSDTSKPDASTRRTLT